MLKLLIEAIRSARDARKRGRTAILGAFWLVIVLAADDRIAAFDLSGDETTSAVLALVVVTEYAWAKLRPRLGLTPLEQLPAPALALVENEVPPWGAVKPYKPPR